MSWGEAIRLAKLLGEDPSSHLAASVNGWVSPISLEYLALKTLIDNYVISKTDKRGKLAKLRDPFAPPPKRFGSARLTIPQLRALLKRHREEAADGE